MPSLVLLIVCNDCVFRCALTFTKMPLNSFNVNRAMIINMIHMAMLIEISKRMFSSNTPIC